jgi:hypothetical protein
MRDFQILTLAQPNIVIKKQVKPGVFETSLPLLFFPELRPFSVITLIGLLVEVTPVVFIERSTSSPFRDARRKRKFLIRSLGWSGAPRASSVSKMI